MSDITQELIDVVYYVRELEDGETFNLLKLCQERDKVILFSGAVGIRARAIKVGDQWKIEFRDFQTQMQSADYTNWTQFEDATTVYTDDCTDQTDQEYTYSKKIALFSNEELNLTSPLTSVYVP